jgi:hypothetical protein
LHLVKGEYGVWNIDGMAGLRYANLDSDSYLDHWQYLEQGGVRQQLFFSAGRLVYAGDHQVLLKQVNIGPALFELQPPRNHEEWTALHQSLEAHQHDFAPGDFKALVAQFEGSEWRVNGAQIRDFRMDGDGFRFVLDLQPGFQVTGSGGPDLAAIAPGSYVITFHGSAFDSQPLTPAQPVIEPESLHLSDSTPTVLEPVQVMARINNVGLEDKTNLPVHLYTWRPDMAPQHTGTQTVNLLAGESVPVRFDWTPIEQGEWQIGLVCGNEISAPQFSPARILNVQASASPALDLETARRLSNIGQPLLLGALVAGLGVSAACLMLVILRTTGNKP